MAPEEYAALLRGCRLRKIWMVSSSAELKVESASQLNKRLELTFEGGYDLDSPTGAVLKASVQVVARQRDSQRQGLKLAASYRMTVASDRPLPEDFVAAYVEHNLLMNLWPFWREWVYATTGRMGLTPITLPFAMMGQAPDAGELDQG